MILLNGRQVPGFALGATDDIRQNVNAAFDPLGPWSRQLWAEILIPTGILIVVGGVWYFVGRK